MSNGAVSIDLQPDHRIMANMVGLARAYDANGNTTLNLDALSSAFIYDDRNRLSQIPGVSSAQYRYNARGERVGKLHTMGYLGGNERISAYDEQGKLMSYVDYRISNLGKRTLAGSHDLVYLDDLPVALLGKGATRYLETDHLGTPRLASNAKTGTTDWQWDFLGDGFGANDASVIDADADLPLRYPGQQYDAESGLHYNYFRDYEPGTGRYTQSDPLGQGGGIATYAYALGSPLYYFDSLGLAPECDGCDDRVTGSKVQQWCDKLNRRIRDASLATCVRNKCQTGQVRCRPRCLVKMRRRQRLQIRQFCRRFAQWRQPHHSMHGR